VRVWVFDGKMVQFLPSTDPRMCVQVMLADEANFEQIYYTNKSMPACAKYNNTQKGALPTTLNAHLRVRTYVSANIRVYTFVCMNLWCSCMRMCYVCACVCAHACVLARVYVCMCVFVCMCV